MIVCRYLVLKEVTTHDMRAPHDWDSPVSAWATPTEASVP